MNPARKGKPWDAWLDPPEIRLASLAPERLAKLRRFVERPMVRGLVDAVTTPRPRLFWIIDRGGWRRTFLRGGGWSSRKRSR